MARQEHQHHHRYQHQKNDRSISFIQKHHFKDTLALLIVFLSFNHFASLCLLISFVIATRSRNFLSSCLITLFLSRKPSVGLGKTPFPPVKFANSKKLQVTQGNKKSHVFPHLLILEVIVAAILKVYGDHYFTRPIENLAMSVVASSLINDPRDCLNYATSCSILYGLSLNLVQRMIQFFDIKELVYSIPKHVAVSKWEILFNRYPILSQRLPYLFDSLKWSNKFIRYCCYFTSCHVVIYQFYQNMTNPHYYSGTSKTTSDPPRASPMVQSNSASNSQASVGVNTASPGNISGTPSSTTLNAPPSLPSFSTIQKPIFTDLISSSKVFELSVTSPSESNSQTISTNITTQSSSSTDSTSYTNQFFKLEVVQPQKSKAELFESDSTSKINLENFIFQLFKWKNHYLIPPLWSMFATIKTMAFEKRYLRSKSESVASASASAPSESTSGNTITPTSSENGSSGIVTTSVFVNPDTSDCMALIAPAADDYNQLNLIPSSHQEQVYKVCVTYIGPTLMTFHIQNLHEGELIVLVNGVIWSQVSSAIVQEKPGEEYTVVSGLVPSCSYDIQFVNRLAEMEDYLIADLIIRTSSKDGSNKELLDFSFPSYYHRKFLSPILTLKHSVLTTNTNLAEERVKLKKTKKELSKKLSGLRQEIDHLKVKICQNAVQDEKSSSKVDNLKTLLHQSESQIASLEKDLKSLNAQQVQMESNYLQKKDKHLQKQMEYSNLEASLNEELREYTVKLSKLQQEFAQLTSKKEKMTVKHEKLQKEVDQYCQEFENFKTQFLVKREKDRQQREESRIREANDYELKIKGLEQDISRLEGENGNMHKLIQGY